MVHEQKDKLDIYQTGRNIQKGTEIHLDKQQKNHGHTDEPFKLKDLPFLDTLGAPLQKGYKCKTIASTQDGI